MVVLSTDSLLVRVADVGAFDVVFWVGALTAVVMLGIESARGRANPTALVRRDGPVVLAAAGLQGVTILLFVAAVDATAVANVAAIIAAAPLGVALLSRLLIGERSPARVWAGIVASMAGIGIVVSGSLGGGSLTGDLFAIGAIVTFGLGTVVLRVHPAISRPLVVGLGGAMVAVASAWPADITGHGSTTWLALIAMGAVLGPLARVMIATAPRYLPSTEVALFAPLEAVLAPVWALLVLDEGPSVRTVIGGTVILAGVLWAVWPRSSEPDRPVVIAT